ncbi:hypothetical protein DPMN_109521 [Dreissena polymorpha]|uniref:Uncharacterized protein n=1 Tax=Dreissena polymorpha TaxID=45954 RepID=A0A9D4KAQ7_DREPO|nr:hypothetical protein DPMN_109521 [Dreissena polymorpha]
MEGNWGKRVECTVGVYGGDNENTQSGERTHKIRMARRTPHPLHHHDPKFEFQKLVVCPGE